MIIILIVISLNLISQENIYISKNANLVTHTDSKIAIFGDLINDANGGFTHNNLSDTFGLSNGGDVFIIRHKEHGSGNSRIYDGPNASKGIDDFNKDGAFCRFWNLHTDNTVGKSIPSGAKVNTDSGAGNIQIEQEVIVNKTHYFDNGMIWTPRSNWKHAFIYYQNISENSDTEDNGVSNQKHIDGYAVLSGNSQDSYFPIGDGKNLRFCGISSASRKGVFRAAYFNQNPLSGLIGISGKLPTGSDSNNLSEYITKICKTEFWDIDGNKEANIILCSNNKIGGYSDWYKNFDKSNRIVITGFNGKWNNLSSYFNPNGSNDSIYIANKTLLNSDYSLFTWAEEDSLINSDVEINHPLNDQYLNLNHYQEKYINFEYSFGYDGFGIAKVYDYSGCEIFTQNIDFINGKNELFINSSNFINSLYFIKIISDKNDILNLKFIKNNN
jgi:hypothetical protein